MLPRTPGHLHAQFGRRHVMAAYDLIQDKLFGHVKIKKDPFNPHPIHEKGQLRRRLGHD